MMLILLKPIYSLLYQEPSLFLDERRETKRESERERKGESNGWQNIKFSTAKRVETMPC